MLGTADYQWRSQDLSKAGGGGGGGHTVSNIIVMAFSPRNIVGCLLKKGLQKGGVTDTQGPPLATPLIIHCVQQTSASSAMFKLFLCNVITVEPRFNEPLFNEVLDITNDIISMSRPKLQ